MNAMRPFSVKETELESPELLLTPGFASSHRRLTRLA